MVIAENAPRLPHSPWRFALYFYLKSRFTLAAIFVFEAAGLCIGHMGHLHHMPDNAQFAALGRLDVVMVAVDGGMTVDQATVVEMLGRLRSSVVIPMHWFGRGTLEAFVEQMEPDFAIDRPGVNVLEVSLRSLPDRPTVVVLEPRVLTEE